MKEKIIENLLLTLLIICVIAFISIVFYFTAKKVVEKVSHSIEPTTKQVVLFEIRV